MKKVFFILFMAVFHSKISLGQSIDFIIQVNDTLQYEQFTGMVLIFNKGRAETRIPVDYFPGRLVLSKEAWDHINADTTANFTLYFNYHTHWGKDQQIAQFDVELNWKLIHQRYLVLNMYDFRNKKYERWYRGITKGNYLAELRFPNSGIYIRKE
jgi:hypothetical protein